MYSIKGAGLPLSLPLSGLPISIGALRIFYTLQYIIHYSKLLYIRSNSSDQVFATICRACPKGKRTQTGQTVTHTHGREVCRARGARAPPPEFWKLM